MTKLNDFRNKSTSINKPFQIFDVVLKILLLTSYFGVLDLLLISSALLHSFLFCWVVEHIQRGIFLDVVGEINLPRTGNKMYISYPTKLNLKYSN